MEAGRPTDHRNLNLAKLHRDVIREKAGGKIIWQPRIGCWLQDKRFAGEKLPEPYEGLTMPGIYRELGCSARIYEYNSCFKKKDDPQVRNYSRDLSEVLTEHVVETPAGTVTAVNEKRPSSWFYVQKKRWVKTADDLKVFAWMEERCSWEFDKEEFQKVKAEWGDLGAPTIFMPRVNVQNLYIDLMGVENAVFALYDFPETVEYYFQILEESHERLIEAINASPIEIINFGDNVHASTLSFPLFLKYVLPSYQKRNELLHKAGKFTYAHWDGDTKPLLPFAKETGLDGIEAITPKPQGDVTIEEMKEGLGNDLFLIDGIAAILFNDMFSLEALEAQAKKIIEYFAPKLILGISDEISSTGDIERIKFIGRIVDDYNSRLK
jgi:hypothetical protein